MIMNDATQRILNQLPTENYSGGYNRPPNAYVYIDQANRLAILIDDKLLNAGKFANGHAWLGVDATLVAGDEAPFCG
jgi:hypothetical protein